MIRFPAFILLLAAVWLAHVGHAGAQSGCTDPQASNFDPAAVVNDGSCVYANTNLAITTKTNLATPLLDENSGIVFRNGGLWTHNDSGNGHVIYRVDTASNTVYQSVDVVNAVNTDWEDIASDDAYLYIGDFGNNNGNRQNLRIYRVHQSWLSDTATVAYADVINFSYSDQSTFPSLPNNNNFDCEAMAVIGDSLHLFSKNWVDKQTKHYVLPNQTGTHVAQLRETLNAGFLVTGASVQDGGVIALVGYDNAGLAPVYVYMLYDYEAPFFFNGNKRRFNAGNALSYGQVEGIGFLNAAYGYISNERFTQIVNVAPALRTFDLAPYLPGAFVNPLPEAGFTASDTVTCRKDMVAFTDQSLHGAVSWQWLFPGGTPSTSTQQHPQVFYESPGAYDVTLIAGNAAGADTLTKTAYIRVKAQPHAVASAVGPAHCCTGDSVMLEAFMKPGFTYQWKRFSKTLSGATSPVYYAKSTGNYKVVVTNSNGCTKQSAPVPVTGPPKVRMTVTGSLDLCPGDSVRLSIPQEAGNTYQWKKDNVNIPGATDHLYFATAPGRYWVKAVNPYGCKRLSTKKTVTNNCRLTGMRNTGHGIDFHPNPACDELTVFINAGSIFANLRLYSMDGRIVLQTECCRMHTGRRPVIMDVSGLDEGMYYLVVASGRQCWKEKVVVVR